MDILSQRYYVYTLAYPESMGGAVFYVGKGRGYRINQHEQEARLGIGYNPHKERVIREIWDKSEEVVKEKVAFFEDEKKAYLFEQQLIDRIGLNNLTNIAPGGVPHGIISTSPRCNKVTKDDTYAERFLFWLCNRKARLYIITYTFSDLEMEAGTNHSMIIRAIKGTQMPKLETVEKWAAALELASDPDLEDAFYNAFCLASPRQRAAVERYVEEQETEP